MRFIKGVLMWTYETKYSEDELMHHGIPKQKWGVRNGPPYPLSSAKHKMVVNGNKGTNTTGKITHYSQNLSDRFDEVTAPAMSMVKPDGSQIYPPIAAIIRDFEEAGRPLSDVGLDRGKKGFDGVYDEVNPDYGEPGTTNNCPFVGAAVELRSRGYDVIARRANGGAQAGIFERWFKGANNEFCESFDEMEKDIKKDGDGASGVLQGFYGRGLGSGDGGHTVHWHNDNGEIKIIDGQSHKEMSWDEMKSHYKFNESNGCVRTRLDNCEPNWDKLAEDGTIGIDNKRSDSVYKDEVYDDDDSMKKQRKYAWEASYRGNPGKVEGWYRKDQVGDKARRLLGW